MSGRKQFIIWKVLFAVFVLFLLVDNARAYAAPGAGPEVVGYAMSLLAWAGVAFSAMFLYPIYSLIQRLRGRKPAEPVTALPAVEQSETGALQS